MQGASGGRVIYTSHGRCPKWDYKAARSWTESDSKSSLWCHSGAQPSGEIQLDQPQAAFSSFTDKVLSALTCKVLQTRFSAAIWRMMRVTGQTRKIFSIDISLCSGPSFVGVEQVLCGVEIKVMQGVLHPPAA